MSGTRSISTRAPATEASARGPGPDPAWAGAALVLIGLGSESRPEVGDAARAHAEAIRARGLFREVRACFLKSAPDFRDVVAALEAPTAYLLPYFMSGGELVRRAIPEALNLSGAVTERAGSGGPRRLVYCEPLGAAEGLVDVMARRVEALCAAEGLAADATGVLLVAHGTPRDPSSGDTARLQAGRLAATGRFRAAGACFLEEPPYPADAARALAPGPVAVLGFLAERGMHGEEDVPRLLGLSRTAGAPGALAKKEGVYYAGPIGPESEIAEVILEVLRAAPRPDVASE